MNYYLIAIIVLLVIVINYLWLIHNRLSALTRFNSAWLLFFEKDDYDIFTAAKNMLGNIGDMSGQVMYQTELLE